MNLRLISLNSRLISLNFNPFQRGLCSGGISRSKVMEEETKAVAALSLEEDSKINNEEEDTTKTVETGAEEWAAFAEFEEYDFEKEKEVRPVRTLTQKEVVDREIAKYRVYQEEQKALVKLYDESGAANLPWKTYAETFKKYGLDIKTYTPFRARNRPLIDDKSVYEQNAWDNIEWDEEMKNKAKEAVQNNSISVVDPERKQVLENEANSFWDKFYGIHQNKFFRDRNWLLNEFPELESPFGCSVPVEESKSGSLEKRKGESYPGENSGFKVLEIGCGAGNTVFPLLDVNNHPETYVYCCDFSSTAVDIVKNHDKFEPYRCTPFVLDVTEENPATPFPLGSLDVITSIFVLSAISPEKFEIATRNLCSFLKPGGLLLFRDYGRYDLAQLRFKDGRCISDNFYCRGDGTRVYFFLEEEVENLFGKQGLKKQKLFVDKRLQVNRSKELKMYRVWIQGKFQKTTETDENEITNFVDSSKS